MFSDFFQNLGSGLINLILKILGVLINIILLPIDALISTIFPDFSTLITNFNNNLNVLFGNSISYIMYHIPPLTKYVILFYITLLIGYYSVKYVYRGMILLPKIINKIKFW